MTSDRSPFASNAAPARVGVLIVNLGTPEGTDYWSMRRYLSEFLSDKRVIEWSQLYWQPILQLIVLSKRPQKVGKAYEEIWNREKNESFLLTYTRSQSDLLGLALKDLPNVKVDWAMRYGKPSIQSQMQELKDSGCDKILVYPLYPQYSASTTATVNDEAFKALLKMRWQPALRTVAPYPDDATYIDALANSIEAKLATLDWEPEVLLTSFHGIPQSYAAKGDPYPQQCQVTYERLRERLGWSGEKLRLTFQSRFGPEEWLQPYTDKTVEELAAKGVKRLAVMNPGFVSDCLETLEEIAGEAGESFLHNGGEKFVHIPCLNDTPEGMRVIEAVVRRELAGWV